MFLGKDARARGRVPNPANSFHQALTD